VMRRTPSLAGSALSRGDCVTCAPVSPRHELSRPIQGQPADRGRRFTDRFAIRHADCGLMSDPRARSVGGPVPTERWKGAEPAFAETGEARIARCHSVDHDSAWQRRRHPVNLNGLIRSASSARTFSGGTHNPGDAAGVPECLIWLTSAGSNTTESRSLITFY
jgi:hypothetical protein